MCEDAVGRENPRKNLHYSDRCAQPAVNNAKPRLCLPHPPSLTAKTKFIHPIEKEASLHLTVNQRNGTPSPHFPKHTNQEVQNAAVPDMTTGGHCLQRTISLRLTPNNYEQPGFLFLNYYYFFKLIKISYFIKGRGF